MPNSSQRNALLVFALFVFLALSFSVFMFINGDFGASRARASDSTTGDSSYRGELSFEARGQLLGRKLYRASSQQAAYTVSGLKAISRIKFVATNLPSPAQLSFCVQEFDTEKNAERALLCEYRNLERSATAEWSLSLETPILVGRDKDYYCTAELELPLQAETTDLAVSSAQLACDLTMADITGLQNLALSVAGLPVTGGRFLGGEAASASAFAVSSAANLAGVYSTAAGDSGADDQRVANICVNSDFGRSCAADFEYTQGQDGLYSPSYRSVGKNLDVGQKLSTSCDAQTGRYARCQQFLQFSWNSKDAISLFSDGVVDSSRIIRNAYTREQLQRYCAASQPFLMTSRGFLAISNSSGAVVTNEPSSDPNGVLQTCQQLFGVGV